MSNTETFDTDRWIDNINLDYNSVANGWIFMKLGSIVPHVKTMCREVKILSKVKGQGHCKQFH